VTQQAKNHVDQHNEDDPPEQNHTNQTIQHSKEPSSTKAQETGTTKLPNTIQKQS
jgi:hypothetical protein